MKRQTNSTNTSSNSNAGAVLALVAAAALVVSACGGMEPRGAGAADPAQPALDVPADEPMLVDPSFEPAQLHPNTNDRIDPAQLQRVSDKNVSELSGQSPEYKKAQVLELCNGGALRIEDERVQQQLKGTFTLELWINARDEGDQTVVQAEGLSIGIRDQRVQAKVAEQELVGLNVVSNEWYHVALVVSGQEQLLYVNGMLLDSKDVSDDDWKRPRGALVIGGAGDEGFCGKLDSVRLTGERLYAGDFYPQTELRKLDAGAFFYNFDDQRSAETVFDAGYWKVNARIEGEAAVVPGSV